MPEPDVEAPPCDDALPLAPIVPLVAPVEARPELDSVSRRSLSRRIVLPRTLLLPDCAPVAEPLGPLLTLPGPPLVPVPPALDPLGDDAPVLEAPDPLELSPPVPPVPLAPDAPLLAPAAPPPAPPPAPPAPP